MDLLTINDFVTRYIGHFKNLGPMSYEYPQILTHFIIQHQKKSCHLYMGNTVFLNDRIRRATWKQSFYHST